MKSDVKLALRELGIFFDRNTFCNENEICDSLMSCSNDEIRRKTKHALTLLQNLPRSALGSGVYDDKEEHQFFNDMIENAIYDEEKDIIKMELKGLKSYLHQAFVESAHKVFGKVFKPSKKKASIYLDFLTIPGDVSKTKFDGCEIAMTSLDASTFLIDIIGSSAILILVYYLRKVLRRLFQKMQLSSSEEEVIDDSSDEELPEVERRYGVYSSTPAEAETIIISEESGAEHSSLDREEICEDCALVQSSFNISNLLSSSESLWGKLARCSTLCLDHDESFTTFAKAFCNKISEKDFFLAVNMKKHMKNLKKNMKDLFSNVVDLRENGRLRLYCKILEEIAFISLDDQDKVITLLNEIANIIVDQNFAEIEEVFSGKSGKNARKSLLRYMGETSNFLSLQAVVETLIIFHKSNVDISILLPEELRFLNSAIEKMPENDNSVNYHHALSNITRQIIVDVLNEKSIEVYELASEEFINDVIPAGRDLYLYYQKEEHVLCHLVVFCPNNVYLERIQLESFEFEEETASLVNDHWRFTISSKVSWQKLLDIKMKLKEQISSELMEIDDSTAERNVEDKEHTNIKSDGVDFSAESSSGIVEEIDESTEDDYVNCILKAAFMVKKEDIKEYWDPDRSFYRHQTGRDWPMMYGSPCAVVVGNVHVKVVDSRKRKCNFAKLTGTCIICKATHIYNIEKSPFMESLLSDGSMEYETVMDMIVVASVDGKFHVVDDIPDITKPVHSIENAKGLDLRGEERRLLGIKASMEGAAPVYREGMAYLQREQIEASNRTSIRSLPVIR